MEWRDFPRAWKRPTFDREHKIRALAESLHLFAELTEQRSYERDNLYLDTAPARHVSAEIKMMTQFDRLDYDGWEARLVDLSRDRRLTRARKGSGAQYGKGVARGDVLEARARFVEELDRFRDEVDADLASLLRRDLEGSLTEYERLKARAGALDFLDLLVKARDCAAIRTFASGSRTRPRPFSSTSSRIRIPYKRKSSYCSLPMIRPCPIVTKCVRCPASSSSWVTRSNRSIASAVPTWPCIAGFVRCSRRAE